MDSPVRILKIKQDLSDKTPTLSDYGRDDICFFRFIGGNASETEKLSEQLYHLKTKRMLLVGIFRFPFRFEGKKRMQTAINQYYRMKEICDAITYLNSDGMMEILPSGTSIKEAQGIFDSLEEEPIRAIEETIRVSGDMNIDVHDIRTFVKNIDGPLYLRTFEGETFDEPLKYVISAPYLPQDYAEGKQMIINIGYTKAVDMLAFQQINLRLNDLFHKAELFKLGSYFINEPGHRFKITLFIQGLQDPFPRPDSMQKYFVQRLWLKGKWEIIFKGSRGEFGGLSRKEKDALTSIVNQTEIS